MNLNFNALLSAALEDTRSNTSLPAGLEGTGSKKGLSIPYLMLRLIMLALKE